MAEIDIDALTAALGQPGAATAPPSPAAPPLPHIARLEADAPDQDALTAALAVSQTIEGQLAAEAAARTKRDAEYNLKRYEMASRRAQQQLDAIGDPKLVAEVRAISREERVPLPLAARNYALMVSRRSDEEYAALMEAEPALRKLAMQAQYYPDFKGEPVTLATLVSAARTGWSRAEEADNSTVAGELSAGASLLSAAGHAMGAAGAFGRLQSSQREAEDIAAALPEWDALTARNAEISRLPAAEAAALADELAANTSRLQELAREFAFRRGPQMGDLREALDRARTVEKESTVALGEQLVAALAATAEASAIPANPAFTRAGQGDLETVVTELFHDPAGVVKGAVLRSLPSMLPSVIAGGAGMLAAGPVGAAALGGLAGGGVEYGASIQQTLQASLTAAKVDITDPDAVTEWALAHPEEFQAMLDDALIQAGAVGAVDALTAGLGGKVAVATKGLGTASRITTQLATETVLEGSGEAGGSALGQYLTTGELPPSGQLALEFFAGAVMGGPSAALTLGAEAVREARDSSAVKKIIKKATEERQAAAEEVKTQLEVARAAVEESKVFASDPEAIRTLLATDDDGDAFIPAAEIARLYQEGALTDEDIKHLGVEAELGQQEEMSGDVAVKRSSLLTVQGDAFSVLVDHVRATPEGITLSEARANAANLESEVTRLEAKMTKLSGAAVEIAQLSDAIYDSIPASPQVSRRQRRAVAELMAQRYATRAAMFGPEVTAQSLYEADQLVFQQQQQAAAGLQQSAPARTEAFMEELFATTAAHPFDARVSMIGMVGVDVSPFDGAIHLGDIRNYGPPRQGAGTEALNQLKALADKYGVTITGTAKVYDQRAGYISKAKDLVAWYKKNGFEVGRGNARDGYEITYTPKAGAAFNQEPVAAAGAAPAAPARATLPIVLTANEEKRINPIYTGKVPAKKLAGNEAAAMWLEENFAGDPITDFTAELDAATIASIGNVMAAEAELALQKTGNAYDWYSGAMTRMLDVAAVKWPMLTNDAAAADAGFGTASNARFVFTFIMAITSQNLDVAANAVATNKAFDAMLLRVKAGNFTMDPAWGTGDKQKAMGENFKKFGPLIAAMKGANFPEKLAKLDALFREKMTVAEWVSSMKAAGIPYTPPSSTNKDVEVYGSSLLGPKIGNGFWQNLNGNFSPLTIDLWMRRTWGRLTGKSIGNPSALPAQRARLKASIARSINSPDRDVDALIPVLAERRNLTFELRALEARTDMKKKDQTEQVKALKAQIDELTEVAADLRGLPPPEGWKPIYDTDDAALAKYAKRLLTAWNREYKRLSAKYPNGVPAKAQPTWARAAKRLKADLTTPLDQVSNGTQRKQIEAAVRHAQQVLTQRGLNITTADLQAILWYPEKELWGALTTALAVDDDGVPVILPSPLNESYDTAFTRILKGEGYDTGQQAAAGAASAGGGAGAVAGSDAAGTGPVGQQDTGVAGQGGAGSAGQAGAAELFQEPAGVGRDGGLRSEPYAPLSGAPTIQGATGPDPRLVSAAEAYAASVGIELRRQGEYVGVDEDRAKRIAQAYEDMKHDPQDPAVKEAYQDLIRQTTAQYQALVDAGYQFYFFDPEGADPYGDMEGGFGNPWNAMRDLRANQRMAVYATQDGYGSDGPTGNDVEDQPLLVDTGLTWPVGSLDGPQKSVLANDLFRAVHDAFGHGLEGAGFRARGEENAWQAHVRLFYGPAVGAMTSETRGQNSWLNFGPSGEANRKAKVQDTTFAQQKFGLMPEWTWTEGRAADAPATGAQNEPRQTDQPSGAQGAARVLASVEDFQRINSADDAEAAAAAAAALLEKDGWAVLTATLSDLDQATNDANNAQLQATLEERGIPYMEVEGYYLGEPDGRVFMVLMPEADALALGQQYQQDSVLTRNGWVYGDETRAGVPLTGEVFTGQAAQQQAGYTMLPSGRALSFGMAFEQRPQTEDKGAVGAPKGSYVPPTSADPRNLINLTTTADVTTFVHESGHMFLFQMMQDLADPRLTPEGRAALTKQIESMRGWFGRNADQGLADLKRMSESATKRAASMPDGAEKQQATLRAMRLTGAYNRAVQNGGAAYMRGVAAAFMNPAAEGYDEAAEVVFHEIWARGFEQYMGTGNAPTTELAKLFSSFSKFIVSIYKSLRRLNVEITPEISDVFDRLLAAEEAIQAEQAGAVYQVPDAVFEGATPAEAKRLRELAAEAEVEASTTMQSRIAASLRSEEREKRATRREQLTAEMTDKVESEPVYTAITLARTGMTPNGEQKLGSGPLAYAEVAAVAGEATADALPKGVVSGKKTAPENAIPLSLLRDLAGYDTTEEMLLEMIDPDLESKQDKIKRLVEARMLAEFGAEKDQSRFKEQAVEVSQNEKFQQLQVLLVRVLRRMAGADMAKLAERQTEQRGAPPARADVAAAAAADTALSAATTAKDAVQAGLQKVRAEVQKRANIKGRRAQRAAAVEAATIRRGLDPEAIKLAASRFVGKTAVGDLTPLRYRQAAHRLTIKIEQALASRDYAEAASLMEQRAMNLAIAEQAAAVQAKLEAKRKAWSTRLNRTDKKLAASYDMAHVNTIRALLQPFGFSREVSRNYNPASALAALSTTEPDLYNEMMAALTQYAQITQRVQQTHPKDPVKGLTALEFEQLLDLADRLLAGGRDSKGILIKGERVAFEEIGAAVAANVQQRRSVQKLARAKRAGRGGTLSRKVKRMLSSFKALLRRIELWAKDIDNGNPMGPVTQYLVRPVMEAVDLYMVKRQEPQRQLLALLKGRKDLRVRKPIVAAELGGYTFQNKGELLMAVLHTGNDSNKRKLLLGGAEDVETREKYVWGAEGKDKTLDTSRWDAFLSRMFAEGVLTKADMDLAQGIWDLFETTKQAAQDAHQRMYGYRFAEIEARPVQTPFGEYRGGYAPAITDTMMNPDGDRFEAEQVMSQQANAAMFPAAEKGFTQGRVEYNRPLDLDLSRIPAHLDRVMKFAYLGPAVRNAARLVKNRAFSDAIRMASPDVIDVAVIPWLQRTVQQRVTTPPTNRGWGGVGAVASAINNRVGLHLMAGNILNAAQQITGFSVAAAVVKPRHLAAAFTTFRVNGQWARAHITSQSTFMAERLTAGANEVATTLENYLAEPSMLSAPRRAAERIGYFAQQVAQNLIDPTVWLAAERQAQETIYPEVYAAELEKTGDEAAADAAATEAVVFYADSVVRQTQAPLRPSDISGIEASSELARLFLKFYSYFNAMGNLLVTERNIAKNAQIGWTGRQGRAFYAYLMIVAVPSIVAEGMAQGMRGNLDDLEDEDELDQIMLDVVVGSQLKTLMAMVPYAGQVGGIVYGTVATEAAYDDKLSMPAGLSVVSSTVSSLAKLVMVAADPEQDVDTKKAIKTTLDAFALATGVPTNWLSKPLQYAQGVQEGKNAPEGLVDLLQGALTGKDGTER
jgi:hypothetical protein